MSKRHYLGDGCTEYHGKPLNTVTLEEVGNMFQEAIEKEYHGPPQDYGGTAWQTPIEGVKARLWLERNILSVVQALRGDNRKEEGMITIKNARIKSTFLGIEDHGIFTFYLNLELDSGLRAFGGWALDAPPAKLAGISGPLPSQSRKSTSFGADMILQVLEVLGVGSWEKLPGTACRAQIENDKIIAVGHYLKEEWLRPQQLIDVWKEITS